MERLTREQAVQRLRDLGADPDAVEWTNIDAMVLTALSEIGLLLPPDVADMPIACVRILVAHLAHVHCEAGKAAAIAAAESA